MLNPRSIPHDIVNRAYRYAKLLGKLSESVISCGVKAPYLSHLLPGEFTKTASFTHGRILAPSLYFVMDIVNVCACTQVCGVTAGRVVATVPDNSARRRRVKRFIVGQFPGYAVGLTHPAFYSKLTIPVLIPGTQPHPAGVVTRALINLCIEPLNKWGEVAPLVPIDEALGLAFDFVEAPIRQFSKRRRLPTTALAKLYNSHVIASSKVIATPGLLRAAPGFVMPNYTMLGGSQ